MPWNIPVFDSAGKVKDARLGILKPASSASSINILLADGVVTDGAQAVKRWNPGHYIRPQGAVWQADQDAYFTAMSNVLAGKAQDIPEFLGIFFSIMWGRGNPTGSTFFHDDIDTLLNQAISQGQRIILMPHYKSFSLPAAPIFEAPADLLSQVDETNQGFWGGLHRTDTMSRYIDYIFALGERYDDEDGFEMLITPESAPSFGGGFAPDDYEVPAYSIELQRLYTALEEAFPKTNVCPGINSLTDQMGNLHEKCFDLRIGISGPDAQPTIAWQFFEGTPAGGETPVRDYRGQMARAITISQQVLGDPINDLPADVIDFMQTGKVTHAMWIDNGAFFESVKTAIQADPNVHAACPTRYLSCTFLPPSQPITAINFNFGTLLNTTPGNTVTAEESDNWPITWAWNGHQYTSFGDGEGFHNLSGNQTTRASIGVTRIEGDNSNYSAFDVFKSGKNMPDSETGKCYGMLGANGKLYMAWDFRILESVRPGRGSGFDRYEESTICSSSDGGASWTEEIRWNGSDWGNDLDGFYGMSFVNYGQDHGGARSPKTFGAYIYLTICEHDNLVYDCQIPGGIGLMRVLEANIESGNKADWEYLSAIDGNNSPSWSTVITDRINHFQDSQDGNDVASIIFNEPLGRYLLTTFHNQRNTGPQSTDSLIGIYEAPEPWGPWTTVLKTNVETLGLADGPNVIFWNFSNKWLSADGLTFTMVGTLLGKDEWGTIEGTFTV